MTAFSTGSASRPISVSRYSTRTGEAGMTSRCSSPASSSSRSRRVSIGPLMPGIAALMSAKRRDPVSIAPDQRAPTNSIATWNRAHTGRTSPMLCPAGALRRDTPIDERLQGYGEVAPAFAQAVEDLDWSGRHDGSGDKPLGLELLQPQGEQSVRYPVHAPADVPEALGADGKRAQDGCVPAAADDLDGGLEPPARLVVDDRRTGERMRCLHT